MHAANKTGTVFKHCVYNCASENVIQIYQSNSCIVTIGPGKLFGHLLDKVYIDCDVTCISCRRHGRFDCRNCQIITFIAMFNRHSGHTRIYIVARLSSEATPVQF